MSVHLLYNKLIQNRYIIKLICIQDITGQVSDEAKQELIELVEVLQHPSKFKDFGAKLPKGRLDLSYLCYNALERAKMIINQSINRQIYNALFSSTVR